MFKRFLAANPGERKDEPGARVGGRNGQREREDEHDQTEEEGDDEDDVDEDGDEQYAESEDENVEALLIPSDHEKKALLASFDAMRKESLFCDVAFISQGVLFRCHRVVVSSWSRWMRTFLCDSPEEEILSLDIFTPDAFQAVLDYMYGYPLQITEQRSDAILKVVRRLEMHKLEQQIWRYLITILNDRNCDFFHELADRYDCPPLKLAAWRLLKEKLPGLTAFPTKKALQEALKVRASALNGTGLISPGDALFNTLAIHHPQTERNGMGGALPSVFDNESDDSEDDEDDEDEDDEDDYDEHGRRRGPRHRRDRRRKRVLRLEELDAQTTAVSATTVVQAWAVRLKEVYQNCMPEDEDVDLDRLRLYEDTPNVKLSRVPRPQTHPQQQQQQQPGAMARARPSPLSPAAQLSPQPMSRVPQPPSAFSPGPPQVNTTHINLNTNNLAATSSSAAAGAGAGAGAAGGDSGAAAALSDSAQVRVKTVRGVRTIDWEGELAAFYEGVGAPQKIAGIPSIMKAWAGREEKMLQNLAKKYEGQIPKKVQLQLERVYSYLETQTETSRARHPGDAGQGARPRRR